MDLCSRFTQERLEELFASVPYRPFWPPASDRAAWENVLSHPIKSAWAKTILSRAEEDLGKPWADLPLTQFMRFVREGNRKGYEKLYFSRRFRLCCTVLAECLEHKGRFLDEVANGIWAMLSEPTWIIPAHSVYQKKDGSPWGKTDDPDMSDPVPCDTEYSHVDLFAAETGSNLTFALQLLGDELHALSPMLCERLKKALWERIVLPVEAAARRDNDIWWMVPNHNGDHLNNWTPWCVSNCFAVFATLMPEQPARLAYTTRRFLEAVDNFLLRFPEDGVCDEGPSYWNVSTGAFFHFLAELDIRTGGACASIYQEPQIRAMAEYICKVNLTGDYMLSHSDCPARILYLPGIMAFCGKKVHSDYLLSFADKWMLPDHLMRFQNPRGGLMNFFEVPEEPLPPFQPHLSDWLPNGQLLVARQFAEDGRGTVLGAKGGNNGEGHNHNDVGQFTVFRDGKPVVVDVGTFLYTRDTFSARRYQHWWISGIGHNAPIINGFMQQVGGNYAAQVLEQADDGATCSLRLDLSHLLPPEAQVLQQERSFRLERNSGTVCIQDTCTVAQAPLHVQIHLYSPTRPEQNSTGLAWPNMHLETDLRCAVVEPVDVHGDETMLKVWGNEFYHILLEGEFSTPGASWHLTFLP
ncbi:MAG: heparinase II/III family protein [Victivallales bacterium]|nr:heparinase II/III family protein [Victivallales bacterium]